MKIPAIKWENGQKFYVLLDLSKKYYKHGGHFDEFNNFKITLTLGPGGPEFNSPCWQVKNCHAKFIDIANA